MTSLDIAVGIRKENICCSILPNAETPMRKHLVLNLVNNSIGLLGDMPMQGSVQFQLPRIELHPEMLAIVHLLIDRGGQRTQEELCLLIILLIKQEIHITCGSPLRPLVTLAYPLPFHQHGLNPGRIHFAEQIFDETVYSLVATLQRIDLLKERQRLRLGHFPILHMLQPGSNQAHYRLLIGQLVQRLKIHRFKKQKPHTLFSEAGTEEWIKARNGAAH